MGAAADAEGASVEGVAVEVVPVAVELVEVLSVAPPRIAGIPLFSARQPQAVLQLQLQLQVVPKTGLDSALAHFADASLLT